MLCQKCGANIPDTDMYCPSCGALRPAPPPGRKACAHCKSYIPTGAKTCPVCRKSQGLSCSGMIGAFIFVIVALFLLVAFSGGNDKSTSSSKSKETTSASTKADKSEDVNQEILEKLEQVAKENLGENYEVKYWEDRNGYSISCWADGLASVVASGIYTDEWHSMVISAANTSSIGAQGIREIDPSADLYFIICNETNTENMFVLTMNGEVLYDVLDPDLSHY